MKTIKERALTGKQKKDIKESVNNNAEYLEEVINDRLTDIIQELGIETEDALPFAREIFYGKTEKLKKDAFELFDCINVTKCYNIKDLLRYEQTLSELNRRGVKFEEKKSLEIN